MADRLNPGDSLTVGGSITSQDGRFTLILQADGNLVQYQTGGPARWAAGHLGTVSRAVMQADGNFVLYGPTGPLWATVTDGHPGSYLLVQNDGHIVIYGPSGPLWANSRVNPNQILAVGGSITSQDGRFTLHLQEDGNLVLYQSGTARWATGTVGRTVSRAVMQADGNFVLYGPTGPLWATATDGHPGSYLVVQNDGNLVVYSAVGPLWSVFECLAAQAGIRKFTIAPRQIARGTSITIKWGVSAPSGCPVNVRLTQTKFRTAAILATHNGLSRDDTLTDRPEVNSDYFLDASVVGGLAAPQKRISVAVSSPSTESRYFCFKVEYTGIGICSTFAIPAANESEARVRVRSENPTGTVTTIDCSNMATACGG